MFGELLNGAVDLLFPFGRIGVEHIGVDADKANWPRRPVGQLDDARCVLSVGIDAHDSIVEPNKVARLLDNGFIPDIMAESSDLDDEAAIAQQQTAAVQRRELVATPPQPRAGQRSRSEAKGVGKGRPFALQHLHGQIQKCYDNMWSLFLLTNMRI